MSDLRRFEMSASPKRIRSWFVGALVTAAAAFGGAGFNSPAQAQEKATLVWVGYGGPVGQAVQKMWLEPFMKENPNIRVVYETGVQWAKLKAMRETGNITWDLYEGDLYATDPENYFEKIDCTVVACSEIMQDSNRTDYTMLQRTGINGYGYDKRAFRDNPPSTWEDFYDLKKFPGVRGVSARPTAAGTVMMGAMVGSGIPRDKIVPYQIDAAIAALDKLKNNKSLIFFPEDGACTQLLRDKEAVMAGCASGDIIAANEDGADLGFAWGSSIVIAGTIAVVKGTKYPKEAMKLIAYIVSKENNAKLTSMVTRGPVNTLAFDKVDPKYKAWTLAGHPELKPLAYDWPYLRQEGEKINNAYLKWVTGAKQ